MKINKMYVINLMTVTLSFMNYASDVTQPIMTGAAAGSGVIFSASGANVVRGLIAYKQGISAGKAGMQVVEHGDHAVEFTLPHQIKFDAFRGGVKTAQGQSCSFYGTAGQTAKTVVRSTVGNPACQKLAVGATVAGMIYSAASQAF